MIYRVDIQDNEHRVAAKNGLSFSFTSEQLDDMVKFVREAIKNMDGIPACVSITILK